MHHPPKSTTKGVDGGLLRRSVFRSKMELLRRANSSMVIRMSVAFELELPEDLASLRLPPAVDRRLQYLLDRQDQGISLTDEERTEAEGLVDLAEMLSLLRLRATRKP